MHVWSGVAFAMLALAGATNCGGQLSSPPVTRDAASEDDATTDANASDGGACRVPMMTLEQACSSGIGGRSCPPSWGTPEYLDWCRKRFVDYNGVCHAFGYRCPGYIGTDEGTGGCGGLDFVFDATTGRLVAALWTAGCGTIDSASDDGVCIPREFPGAACTSVDPCPSVGVDGGSPCHP